MDEYQIQYVKALAETVDRLRAEVTDLHRRLLAIEGRQRARLKEAAEDARL